MSNQPTVFVVDHDAEARGAVRDLAGEMSLPCEEFGSGAEFLDSFDRRRPGCLVLEVRIRDVSGPQIQRRLLAEGAGIPVIFLAAQASVSVVVQAVRDGAVYFLEKPCDEQQLWEAIQAGIRLDKQRRREGRQRREVKARVAGLKPPELEVLRMVVEGRQNKEIARQQNVSLRTVEARRGNVMRKLEAGSLAELLQIALSLNGELRANGNKPREAGDLSGRPAAGEAAETTWR